MDIRKSPTLYRARKALRLQLDAIPAGKTPVVALSGGADSLALTFVASLEGVKNVHIVDHGLQEVTAEVAREMSILVEKWGMSALVTRVHVSSEAAAKTGGMENAARDARYEALLADDSHVVLLAHTLRDQAETVLMGLARGSGTRSLQGMKTVSRGGRLVRPFLELTREDMEIICEEFDLPYWNDPHNEMSDYTRVRVRNELLPLMEEIMNGGVAEALFRTALLLQEDNDALDVVAEEQHTLDAKELSKKPAAIRKRIIREFLISSGSTSSKITYGHILSVDSLITDWRGQKGVSVPRGLVRRIAGQLVFEKI